MSRIRDNGLVRVNVVESDCNVDIFSKPIGDLRQRQLEDPELEIYLKYIEEKQLPTEETQAKRVILESVWMEVKDGVLYRTEKNGRLKLIPPREMRTQLMEDLHGGRCSAHLGLYKTMGRVEVHYWWPGWRKDLRLWCERCAVCQSRRKGPTPRAPLTSIPTSEPFEIVGVDVLQMPRTRSGKQYVVVFVDHFTKWPEVYATSNQEALTIAKLLVERIVLTHSVPRQLLSDRGTNFTSTLMSEVYRLLGIKKIYTTAYHPQTDGTVERFNSWRGRLRPRIRKLSVTRTSMQEPGRCKRPNLWQPLIGGQETNRGHASSADESHQLEHSLVIPCLEMFTPLETA